MFDGLIAFSSPKINVLARKWSHIILNERVYSSPSSLYFLLDKVSNNLVEIQDCLQEEFKSLRSYKNASKNGVKISLLPDSLDLVFESNKIVLSDSVKLEIQNLIVKAKMDLETKFVNLKTLCA